MSVILLAILPKVLNGIQEAAFVAHGRVEFETLTRLVSTVTYIAIGVELLNQGQDVPALLRTYVGIEYLVMVVYFVLISRFIAPLRLQFHWPLAARLLNEMKAFTGSTALAALFARPEIVILSLMASVKEVGYYSAAIRIAELPLFVPSVFMLAVFPLMSQAFGADEQRFRELQAKAIRYMLAFSLPLAALIFVLADKIVPGLYGERLDPAIDLLRILSLNVVLFSVIEVLWRTLAARGRQDVVLRVQLLLVGARLGGGALLIAPLAALGAAIASAANSVLHLVLLARGAARSGAPAPILRPRGDSRWPQPRWAPPCGRSARCCLCGFCCRSAS